MSGAAPLASTLITPYPNFIGDLQIVGPNFQWQYWAAGGSGPFGGWAFYRHTVQSGIVQYWNAATGLWVTTDTPIFNSLAPTYGTFTYGGLGEASYTFPILDADAVNTWDNGLTAYQWAIACEDSYDNAGPLSGMQVITGHVEPDVTITAPGATSRTGSFRVAWSTAFADDATQSSYRVVVTNAEIPDDEQGQLDYSLGTIPADYSVFLADSGILTGETSTWTVPGSAGITNGQTVYVYVMVVDSLSTAPPWGGPWASTSTVATWGEPPTPTMTVSQRADPVTEMPRNLIGTFCRPNLLGSDDASFEAGTLGDWAVSGLSTDAGTVALAVSETWAADGSWSMEATPGAVHQAVVLGLVDDAIIPCAPGVGSGNVTVLAHAHSVNVTGTSASALEVGVVFLNGTTPLGTGLGQIQSVDTAAGATGSPLSRVMGGTIEIPATLDGQVPTGFIPVVMATDPTGCLSSTFWDMLGAYWGTVDPDDWSAGVTGNVIMEIDRSTDGVNWTAVRPTDSNGDPLPLAIYTDSATFLSQANDGAIVTVPDNESPLTVVCYYRARTWGTTEAGGVNSAFCPVQMAPPLPTSTWWVLNPLNPQDAMSFFRTTPSTGGLSGVVATTSTGAKLSIIAVQAEEVSVSRATGRPTPIVRHGTLFEPDMALALMFLDQPTLDAFVAVFSEQATLCWRQDNGLVYYGTIVTGLVPLTLRSSDRVDDPKTQVNIVLNSQPVP